MTYEDLDYCNDLVEKIKNIKREVEIIDNFLNRLNIAYTNEARIKLAEGYQSTPVISVNKNLLFDFVESTKSNCNNKIKELEHSLKNYNSNNTVEIVRCKDCSSFMSCNRTEGPDWFCPKGK